MRLGFFQYAPQERSVAANITFIIEETQAVDDALIVLPELFLGSAVPIPIEQLEALIAPLSQHAEQQRLVFAGSVALQTADGSYNQGIVLQAGQMSCITRKWRLMEQERAAFIPGSASFMLGTLQQHAFTLQIGLDSMDPCAARDATHEGMEILLAPAATSDDLLRTILQARSLENQVIALFCNRSGGDPEGLSYAGKSAIFLPNGYTVTAAAHGTMLRIRNVPDSAFEQFRQTRQRLVFMQ